MQQLVWDVPAAPPPGGAVVTCVAGDLSPDSHAAVVETLAGVLAEHGRVVLDVSGLRVHHSTAVEVFTAALIRAGGWPWVRLVLARPDATLAALLASSPAGHELPAYADVREALHHVDDRPRLVRATWDFPVEIHAARRARANVREVCARWEVDDDVREAAEIVITELVTNAVEHATSPSVVVVERNESAFRLQVRDYESGDHVPRADVWTAPPTSSPRGRGLAMVAAVSRTWGVSAHPDGKTVWAEMGA